MEPNVRERENLWRLLALARNEDLGSGDLTSMIVSDTQNAEARFVARQPMVVCGAALLEIVAVGYDGGIHTKVCMPDGTAVERGTVLAEWSGPARGVLAAERVGLNFLQRLSAVATQTRQYVTAVEGTGAGIYDTRKTTPGWRELEKYAVRAGGGFNHRRGLYDAVLIKDNHLAILAQAEGVNPFDAMAVELERMRPIIPANGFIELEVDTLEQLARALELSVDIILLDNMSVEQLRQAVAMRNVSAKGRIELEASGGITLATVRAVAQTGVERISVGALTHSAAAVDIALDIELK